MKKYYIEVVGAGGKKMYVCGRYGFVHDFAYASRFRTKEEAEKNLAKRRMSLSYKIKCDEPRVKELAVSVRESKRTMDDEARGFVWRLGVGRGKHFVFDGSTLISTANQLQKALYRVGRESEKKFSVKMVTRDTAYVERIN